MQGTSSSVKYCYNLFQRGVSESRKATFRPHSLETLVIRTQDWSEPNSTIFLLSPAPSQSWASLPSIKLLPRPAPIWLLQAHSSISECCHKHSSAPGSQHALHSRYKGHCCICGCACLRCLHDDGMECNDR